MAGSDSATRVLEIRDNSSLGSGQITFYKGGTLDLGADALTVSNFIFNGNYSSGTKTIKLDSDEAGHTGTIAGAMIIQNGTAGSFEVEVGAADTLTMSGTIGNYAKVAQVLPRLVMARSSSQARTPTKVLLLLTPVS